ncbi:MAG TPA: KH domain-containing protein [bacterium]|nr:KH domain-containing protein [bacterium]
MEELIAYIARNLVDYPDQVEVRTVPGGRTVVYELRVAETDRGRVIGREGQTIQAIRTLLKAATASDHKPVLEVPG